MGYVDGFVIPVPAASKERFRSFAADAARVFVEHGATRVVECWGDDVPDGKLTDFKGSVKASADEVVVFAWIEWPSREARDAGHAKVMGDSRMTGPEASPFDAKRMIYGGFTPVVTVDTATLRQATEG
jgi:uncharacterized protein YbaA (DUF1428 family)